MVNHFLTCVYHLNVRRYSTDCALLAQVGKPWLAVVVANNLPRAGKGDAVPLSLIHKPESLILRFGSANMLAWAKANGCPWVAGVYHWAARGGNLEALKWARENDCPWDPSDIWTCALAARGGHLEVLRWAREHGAQWDAETCAAAAQGGHPEVLRWARGHGACPWDARTPKAAAQGGHLETLKWAREHDCP